LRVLAREEKIRLYKFVRAAAAIFGAALVIFGTWELVSSLLANPRNLSSWFGIFPVYVGAMILLIAAAIKEDWFTNARRYI